MAKGKKQFEPKTKSPKEIKTPGKSRKSECNDWSWYAQSEQLLKDTASLAYSQMLGMKLDTQGVEPYVRPLFPDTSVVPNIIPGIMVFDLEPTLGCGSTEVDAPTVSSRATYTYVRHMNSGSANYEAPDLFMYIAAYISAASLLEDAKRAYSIMRTYALKNRYFAKSLTCAAGYDYDDFITKLADFRAFINISCARLNSLKVPTTASYILRQLWISANYYMDEESSKGQIYLMRFKRFMSLEATRWETGTGISFMERPSLFTLETFKGFVDNLLEKIISNEDFNIMSGDILKAFGSNVFTLTTIPEDYQVLPSKIDPVMDQIHNLTLFPVDDVLSKTELQDYRPTFIHTIRQDEEGAIVEEFNIKTSSQSGDNPLNEQLKLFIDGNITWLDMHMDAPEPKDTIVATRLTNKVKSKFKDMPIGTTIPANTKLLYLDCSGTEVVTGIRVYGNPSQPDKFKAFSTIQDDNLFKASSVAAVSTFDYHPHIYIYHVGVAEGYTEMITQFDGVISELNNVVPLGTATLENMHKMAVLSELDFMNNLTPEKGGFMK